LLAQTPTHPWRGSCDPTDLASNSVKLTGCVNGYKTRFCNPWLSGFACYSRTFRLSFLPLARDSGTVPSNLWVFSLSVCFEQVSPDFNEKFEIS
jgi:hypothetical protein